MASELKPCPFCGCAEQGGSGIEATRSYMYTGSGVCIYDYWLVVCHRCKGKSGDFGTEEEAVAAWNRRAGDGK